MWREMRYKIILSGIYVKICKSSKHNTYCMYQLLHFVNERIHVFLVIHRANTSYYVISSLCWKRSVFSMWYELNFLILLRRPSLSLSLSPLCRFQTSYGCKPMRLWHSTTHVSKGRTNKWAEMLNHIHGKILTERKFLQNCTVHSVE